MGPEAFHFAPGIAFVISRLIALFGDPGAGLLYGPAIFKLVWDRIRLGAHKRKLANEKARTKQPIDEVAPAEEPKVEASDAMEAADPLINLAIHIFSFITAYIYFILINLPRMLAGLKAGNDLALIAVLMYLVAGAGGLFIIVGKFAFKSKLIEAYYKIDSDQFLPPNVPFTFIRFGFAGLYLLTAFLFSMSLPA